MTGWFITWIGRRPSLIRTRTTGATWTTPSGRPGSITSSLAVRVDRAPLWARPGLSQTAPPQNPDDLKDFLQALASRSDVPPIDAYIIWNEPNLASEWGNQAPDAADYAALLQAAYAGVKAGNPNALVISAGLATTNGDPPNAVDDGVFLQAMYDAGAKDDFDGWVPTPWALLLHRTIFRTQTVTTFPGPKHGGRLWLPTATVPSRCLVPRGVVARHAQ